MKLKLVKATKEYQHQITDMLDEWYATGEKIIPYVIRRLDYHDFDYYCANLEVKDTSNGLVPDSTFFCLDEERDRMVGAVNIRHYLNEALLLNGGHIGDGVRPSERRKGIATKMIGLALEECRKLGIDKVLMVCDKENIGSAKSIANNGGVLENEVVVDGVVEQRYWITLGKGLENSMNIKTLISSDEMWNKVKTYAEKCSWKAGKFLAHNMDINAFKDWERVIVAIDNDKICGYCTVTKTDCISNVEYAPYIGYIFVDEVYRGNRLSQQLIHYAMNYLKSVGFDKVYIVSDHVNLYEKYGFCVIDRKLAPWGVEEKIYMKKLR